MCIRSLCRRIVSFRCSQSCVRIGDTQELRSQRLADRINFLKQPKRRSPAPYFMRSLYAIYESMKSFLSFAFIYSTRQFIIGFLNYSVLTRWSDDFFCRSFINFKSFTLLRNKDRISMGSYLQRREYYNVQYLKTIFTFQTHIKLTKIFILKIYT